MTAQTLRIFIVDDEPPARSRMRELLQDCRKNLAFEIVGEAGNGGEALDKLMAAPADIVLTDIRMPEMDGVELAQHLNKLDKPPVVIFTTAYDAYAIKAFELHAIDYLLKPVRQARLLDALLRARAALPVRNDVLHTVFPEPRKHLCIHERGKIHLVSVEQVLFMRAELKYVTVQTAEREYLLEEPLTALEAEFAGRMVRIHRNCLVAKDAITGFERGGEEGESGWLVRLKNWDEALHVSRRQQHLVKELN